MKPKPKLSSDLLQQVTAISPANAKQVEEETNQSKTLALPLRSQQFDRIDQENPFTKQGK